jgi:Na+/H+-dicarboxylate symporter
MIKLLQNPRTALVGMILGGVFGLLFPKQTQGLSFLGDFYLSLLKMCVLPIVISTVITSFARLLRLKKASHLLTTMFVTFLSGMLIATLFGVGVGALFSHRISQNPEVSQTLGELITKADISQTPQVPPSVEPSSFFLNLIPVNIFKALTEGQLIPILIAMILLGIALGKNKSSATAGLIEGLEELREAFLRMMGWFITLLPIGVFGIFVGTFSQLKAEVFVILIGLILTIIVGCLFLIVGQLLLLSYATKKSVVACLRAIREPLVIALGTSSSLAALPTTLGTITGPQFKMEKWLAGLLLPLGITFNAQAVVYFNALTTVFICAIYSVPLGFKAFFLIVLGSIFRALSSSGLPGAASLLGMAVIFQPLGIPFESFIGLLLVILPVVDPLLTIVNVIGNFASTSLIARLEKQS